MSDDKPLLQGWLLGDLLASRQVAVSLPPSSVPTLVPAVLGCCVRYVDADPVVLVAQAVCSDESRWPQAHSVFDAIREVMLRDQRSDHEPGKAILFVAENAMRVLYNSLHPADPFDADSLDWFLYTVAVFGRSAPTTKLAEELCVVVRAAQKHE